MTIEISGHRAIADEFDALPSIAQRAIVRSVNRGIDAGQTLIVRAVSKDLGVKNAAVKKAIRNRKATAGNPTGIVAATFRRIPLIEFNARGPEPSRGRGRGVSYKLAGSRGRIASAFIATMPNGKRGVFVRLGRASSRSPKREAIGEKAGPSIGRVFAKFRPAALARAAEVCATTLDREIDYRRAKATGAIA